MLNITKGKSRVSPSPVPLRMHLQLLLRRALLARIHCTLNLYLKRGMLLLRHHFQNARPETSRCADEAIAFRWRYYLTTHGGMDRLLCTSVTSILPCRIYLGKTRLYAVAESPESHFSATETKQEETSG